MAESNDKQQQLEIQVEGSVANSTQQQQQKSGFQLFKKKNKAAKKEKPSDAVKLGCGGLFRRSKNKDSKAGAEQPTEKPKKNKALKAGTVKAEAAAPVTAEKEPSANNATEQLPSIDSLPSSHSLLDAAAAAEKQQKQKQAEPTPSADDRVAESSEGGEHSKAPPPVRPANPPARAPLAELSRKAEEKAEKKAEKAEEKAEKAEVKAEVKAEKAEDTAEEKKAEKTKERAEKEEEKSKTAAVERESEKATEEEEKVKESEEEASTSDSQSIEDEAEKEQQRQAELRFKQASVDMSRVSAKSGVKIEQGPHTDMWSTIVNKSFVGTGTFKKAAVCSLTSGGVLACNPADFTPTVEQVAALRDNFDSRGALSAAGFGVADTVFQLQEKTGTDDILCGADSDHTQAVLVAKTNTALIAAVCTDQLDRATEMLGDMLENFISQGM